MRVNCAAIIADDDAQLVELVFYLDFDPFGSGVTESIDQGLAADAVDFIAYDRVNQTRAAFNNDAKTDRLLVGEFFLNP